MDLIGLGDAIGVGVVSVQDVHLLLDDRAGMAALEGWLLDQESVENC